MLHDIHLCAGCGCVCDHLCMSASVCACVCMFVCVFNANVFEKLNCIVCREMCPRKSVFG